MISKVLEKVVYKTLVQHLNDCNILYHRQFGFRPQHSTTDAVANFVGEVLQSLDTGNMILAIFIDLKKAFDTVNHQLILKKLECLGVEGTALSWFDSYLSGREQFVQIGNSKSKKSKLEVGVAQGSLLGVVLFQLIINDLHKSVKFSTTILYADNTTLLISGKNLRCLKSKMQHDLDHLSVWLANNYLKLNVSKTKYLIFHKEGLSPEVTLHVDGSTVGMVRDFRFLGVLIDGALSFTAHFTQLYEKLLKSCFILRHLGNVLPSSCLRTLYFAFFHSHLTYGSMIWYPLLKRNEQLTLFHLQKRIVRILCKVNSRTHCMPLFKSKGIITLVDQAKWENCKFIYRVQNNMCAKPLVNFFHNNLSAKMYGRTRNSNLSITRHNLAIVNRSFLCKSVMDWSALNTNQKKYTNVKSFGKNLKKILYQ